MTESNGIKGYACPECNWADVYATEKCPRCHNDTKETEFSSEGKIATFTVIRYPPVGFEKESPYVVALIDLEKGPRVIGRITPASENLQIGQRVQFVGNSNGALEFKAQA